MSDPVAELRAALLSVAPYPAGVVPVPELVLGSSFFPGGDGIWYETSQDEEPAFPFEGVMVLGQDYYSKAGYEKVLARSRTGLAHPSKARTWLTLRKLLPELRIAPRRCFFTNLFMGLRVAEENVGKFPGASDPGFVERCLDFLAKQVAIQRPKVILTLGTHVPRYLGHRAAAGGSWNRCRSLPKLDAAGPLLHDVRFDGVDDHTCSIVALTHPSMRNSNVHRRSYKGLAGHEAEAEMVREAIAHSGAQVS